MSARLRASLVGLVARVGADEPTTSLCRRKRQPVGQSPSTLAIRPMHQSAAKCAVLPRLSAHRTSGPSARPREHQGQRDRGQENALCRVDDDAHPGAPPALRRVGHQQPRRRCWSGCQTHYCWLRLASIPRRRVVVVRRNPGQSRQPFVTGWLPTTERIVTEVPDRSDNLVPFLQLILPPHRGTPIHRS